MRADNKETLFQILSGVLIITGILFKNIPAIAIGSVPILFSIGFWYKENIQNPLTDLTGMIYRLRQDLNIRKEIEDLKMEILTLKRNADDRQKFNKKGALDPITYLIILALLIFLILILQSQGIL